MTVGDIARVDYKYSSYDIDEILKIYQQRREINVDPDKLTIVSPICSEHMLTREADLVKFVERQLKAVYDFKEKSFNHRLSLLIKDLALKDGTRTKLSSTNYLKKTLAYLSDNDNLEGKNIEEIDKEIEAVNLSSRSFSEEQMEVVNNCVLMPYANQYIDRSEKPNLINKILDLSSGHFVASSGASASASREIGFYKILHPYQVNANHWELVQLEFFKEGEKIIVDIAVIDPSGGKYYLSDVSKQAFSNVLKSVDSTIEIRYKSLDTPTLQHPEDQVSCGAILVEMIKTIANRRNLSELDSPASIGALSYRARQDEFVAGDKRVTEMSGRLKRTMHDLREEPAKNKEARPSEAKKRDLGQEKQEQRMQQRNDRMKKFLEYSSRQAEEEREKQQAIIDMVNIGQGGEERGFSGEVQLSIKEGQGKVDKVDVDPDEINGLLSEFFGSGKKGGFSTR